MTKKLSEILEEKNEESLRHLITVLSCYLEDADYYFEESMKYKKSDKKYSDEMYKESYVKCDEAEEYLRNYIDK